MGFSVVRVSDRSKGLVCAATTMIMWSTLALSLKITAEEVDLMTICWVRFTLAFAGLFLIQALRGEITRDFFRPLGTRARVILLITAITCLCMNYYMYALGSQILPPFQIQLLLQLGIVLFALGGFFFFKETVGIKQFVGMMILLFGLFVFLEPASWDLDASGTGFEAFGIFAGIMSSVAWAIFALSQKVLLRPLSSTPSLRPLPSLNLTLCVFAGGSILFWPFAKIQSLTELDGFRSCLLGFAGLNTLVAYSALAQAVKYVDASRVSAVLALAPVGTLLSVMVISSLWPALAATPDITMQSIAGALLVVGGSVMVTSRIAGRN